MKNSIALKLVGLAQICFSFLTVTDLEGQEQLPIDTVTKKVVFKEIVELDTALKADAIYSMVKEWFSTNSATFNRSNSDKNFNFGGSTKGNSAQVDQIYKNDQPLKLQDADAKKIIGKVVTKYTGGNMGCIRVLYVESDIKVAVKDAKAKIEITNINYTHYNQTNFKQSQIYGFNDNGPCNSKNTIENLLSCERCKGEFEKFYNFLKTDSEKIIGDLKTFFKDNQNKEDKW